MYLHVLRCTAAHFDSFGKTGGFGRGGEENRLFLRKKLFAALRPHWGLIHCRSVRFSFLTMKKRPIKGLIFMAKNVNFDTNATLLPKVASRKSLLQRYFTALHFCCHLFIGNATLRPLIATHYTTNTVDTEICIEIHIGRERYQLSHTSRWHLNPIQSLLL